ncbi:hypothetical protein JB92DRAFT_2837710 [Gautieria morchelliformis]|nr:hypothetical protein JB92DRAFT_2837710 [Gautieria morchelliformis]
MTLSHPAYGEFPGLFPFFRLVILSLTLHSLQPQNHLPISTLGHPPCRCPQSPLVPCTISPVQLEARPVLIKASPTSLQTQINTHLHLLAPSPRTFTPHTASPTTRYPYPNPRHTTPTSRSQAHTRGSGSPPPGRFTPTTSLSGASPHKLPVEDTPKQPPLVIDTAATDMDNYVASRPSLSDVPDPRQSYLQTDHDLSYYGIYVHLFHHLFICTQCETAVPSDWLPAHLQEHYPEGPLQTPDHQTFDQLVACACLKWGIPNPQDHFAPPPPGSCPIEGVTIHQEGWQCNLCDHACTIKNSITRHVAAYNKAKARDPPKTLYRPSPVQKLFEAQRRCYFSVDLHLLPSAGGDPYSLYVTDHPIAPSEVSPPTVERDIPLLLRETDWHIHFTSELVDPSVRAATQTLLSSAKKPGVGAQLKVAVESWFATACQHIHDQDVLLRRLLAQDGSGPFQPLQEPKTIHDYLSHAINFLSLCIRTLLNLSTTAYRFPLSTDQLEAIDRLLLGLRDGGTPSHTDVQAALWILLCVHPSHIHTNKWLSPVRCYVALWALDSFSDNVFPNASRTAGLLSRMTHLITVCFHEQMYAIHDTYDGMVLRACQQNVQLYLSDTESSPYSFVVQLQRYVTSLAHNEHPPPNITWDLHFTAVTIGCKGTLSLAKYRLGLQRAVRDAEHFLLKTLLRGHDLPLNIPDNFLDDLRNTSVGYGWVNNLPHPDSLKKEPLLALFLREPRSPFILPTTDGRFHLRHTAVRNWLNAYDHMTAMFMCLTQTTLPAPPRGTELLWLIGMYDKTTNTKGHDAYIPRLYPKNVDRLISIWLAFARPLAIRWVTETESSMAASVFKQFMFPLSNKRATSEQFGQALQKFTLKYWDIELSIRDERHLAVALKHELSGDLSKLIQSAVGVALQTHMAGVRSEVKSAIAAGIAEVSMALKDQVLQDVQASSHSGGQRPGVIPEVTQVPPSAKYNPAMLLRLLPMALDNPTAEFTSPTQRSMLQLTAERATNFVAILGTGAGKRLVWDFLANINEKDQITLVVAPYFALLVDQIETRRNRGRLVAKWTASEAKQWATTPRIVYVIPEAIYAATHTFTR